MASFLKVFEGVGEREERPQDRIMNKTYQERPGVGGSKYYKTAAWNQRRVQKPPI